MMDALDYQFVEGRDDFEHPHGRIEELEQQLDKLQEVNDGLTLSDNKVINDLSKYVESLEAKLAVKDAAILKFRQAFVVAVGDKSPFAKCVLEEIDKELAK
jgi:hypothetical protein